MHASVQTRLLHFVKDIEGVPRLSLTRLGNRL
jgi:hypothetical protein